MARRIAAYRKRHQNRFSMFLVTLVVLMIMVVVAVRSVELQQKIAGYDTQIASLGAQIEAEQTRAEQIEEFEGLFGALEVAGDDYITIHSYIFSVFHGYPFVFVQSSHDAAGSFTCGPAGQNAAAPPPGGLPRIGSAGRKRIGLREKGGAKTPSPAGPVPPFRGRSPPLLRDRGRTETAPPAGIG